MTRHSDIPTPPATTPALHVLAISGSTRAGSWASDGYPADVECATGGLPLTSGL
jgi:hypothetical protein